MDVKVFLIREFTQKARRKKKKKRGGRREIIDGD